jgi:hypothetical protein
METDLVVIDGDVTEIEDAKPDLFEKGIVSTEAGLKLNPRQLEVAERYLIHFDLGRAIREIYGFDGQVVYNYVSDLKKNTKFINYVAARIEEKGLAADQVLAQIADIATSSIEDFLRDDMLEDGQAMFDLKKAKDLGKLHLIKRIRYIKGGGGGYEIEMWDRQWALETLAKWLGLLKQEEVQIDNYVINVVREESGNSG